MASDQTMQTLKVGVDSLQKAFSLMSVRRQEYVITAIVARADGATFPETYVAEFERARGSLMRAAQDLDQVLQTLKIEDPAAYLKVIAAFNEQMAKAPTARTSSESVAVVIEDALPPFPRELLIKANTPEALRAVQIEKANYAVQTGPVNGLGFIAAVIAPITASCATATAAVAVTGIGPIVVATGCALLVIGVVVGSLYLVYKATSQLPRLVMAFSPQAAASMAEAERLAAAADLARATTDLSPEARAALLKDLGNPPPSDGIPWALIAVLGVGALIYFMRRKPVSA